MPSRKDRLIAHAEHVLDQFIGLRSKFSVLEPLLFDGSLVTRLASGRRAPALATLTSALVNACVLDIANIALDKDERTPSVVKLVDALDEEQLVAELREDFAIWNLQPTGVSDPDVLRLLIAIDRREEQERRQRFDQMVKAVHTEWNDLRNSSMLSSFGVMRDKLIAHNELWHDRGKYRPLDVSTLGLRFADLRAVIERLEPMVDHLTLLYRNSSYDFAKLNEQLLHARDAFWSCGSEASTPSSSLVNPL